MHRIVVYFVYNFFIITESKSYLWEAEQIMNPAINSSFCKVNFTQISLICDPEDILQSNLKEKLNDYLSNNIPNKTPCLCNQGCDTFDYRNRLMLGLVVVSEIKEDKTCPLTQDNYDCFSEKVLRKWNISECSGNNGLILVTKKLTHIYFGADVRKRIPASCLIRLKLLIRPYIPLPYNLRMIFKHTVQFIRKPCICNDSCSYRHLKWLTNVVFFMGVIVLVTCIGGMSRRALVAKFHERYIPRSSVFSSSFYRQRFVGVRPIQNRTTESTETPVNNSAEPNLPNYSSITPLPKPPPYILTLNSSFAKVHSPNEVIPTDRMEDRPPPYDVVVNSPSNELGDYSIPNNQVQSNRHITQPDSRS